MGAEWDLVAYRVQSLGCWDRLPVGGLPVGWVREAEEDRRGGLGFCPGMEGLESGLSCQVGGHSSLGPLCVVRSKCLIRIYGSQKAMGGLTRSTEGKFYSQILILQFAKLFLTNII